MRLYGYWRSTSSWRVRIVLETKNITYENYPVHLLQDGGHQRTDDYRAKNPLMQVPLLEWIVDGRLRRLSQSVAICEFLDEQYPAPPMMPGSAEGRAVVRQLVEVVNSGIQPIQNLWVLQELARAGVDKKAWAAECIRRGFEALETMLQDTAGSYAFGDQITLADAFLIPQIFNARRFGVDLEPFPTIVRIDMACGAEPAFQAAHPDRQPDAQSAP